MEDEQASNYSDLNLIRIDRISCILSCPCKIQSRRRKNDAGPEGKKRAPARLVLSHKVKDGICFLLCLLDSERAAPTYLRQCQVAKEVRLEYHQYLRANGEPRALDLFWNMEKEKVMRDALFPPLSTYEYDVQVDIALSSDTADWARRTNNGKSVPSAPQPSADNFLFAVPQDPLPAQRSLVSQERSLTPVKAYTPLSDVSQPPLKPLPKSHSKKTATKTKASLQEPPNTWTVEQILGATLNPIKYARKKIFYLIKWEGFSSAENSWESDLLPGCNDAIHEFFEIYGKPTKKKPKVLSPEGAKWEEWKTREIRSASASPEVSLARDSLPRLPLPIDTMEDLELPLVKTRGRPKKRQLTEL
ncbi:hypothetical protein RvY_18223-2 [Ramazzottius varieornatus]|nr:hypothetical protein RvY_18223-2 [Ramazzottius varieornatus]